MKNYCVLLNGAIKNDSRVIRFCKTISKKYTVHLFYIKGQESDKALFEGFNVELHNCIKPTPSWVQKNLFFTKQYLFFVQDVIDSGITFEKVQANDLPTLEAADKIASAVGAKLVYDSHEIYVETINQFFPANAGGIKGVLFTLIIAISKFYNKRLEADILSRVSLFITTNPHYAEHFKKVYTYKAPIEIIMNCPQKLELSENQNIKALSPNKEKHTILYQGAFNMGRGLAELITAFAQLPDSFELIMLGDGALKSSLVNLTASLKLENKVLFLPLVPYLELLNYTAQADLGVLILAPFNLSKRLSSANKIFEYMAAGIPILATDMPENKRIIDECNSGFLLTEISADAIADQLKNIFNSPAEMKKKGSNGSKAFQEKYNWGVQDQKLLTLI